MSVRCWHGCCFFTPLSLPSSSVPTSCTNQCLSTEINCSLTQTKNLPVRRESTIKVWSNCLSPSASPPFLSEASSSVSSLSNLLINQAMHCMSSCCKTPYKHLVRHSTNWLCGCSSGSCGFSQTKVAALMWAHCECWLVRPDCGLLRGGKEAVCHGNWVMNQTKWGPSGPVFCKCDWKGIGRKII